MKFGIFSVVDHYPMELPRSLSQFYAELLDQVVAAEELGFDSFRMGQTPLLLLHGALGTQAQFAPIVPLLAKQ